MDKIKLGLDIGTNSIGWAVLEKQDGKFNYLKVKDEKGCLIPTKGSYIFQKGTDAKENSKAAERRNYRGARRRLNRIILRKIATLKVLNEFGLCPPFEIGELNKWKNKRIYPSENEKFIDWQRTGKKNGNSKIEKLKQPYYLRHLAATTEDLMKTEFGKHQLGRVFYHLAQRRGYLSNGDEEQTEDKLDLFKAEVFKLLDETNDSGTFVKSFQVILDNRKGDPKVKSLGNKIGKELKKEIEFEKIRIFIKTEFDKPENLGKVMKSIDELSKAIEISVNKGLCAPTMGSYFYSIYSKTDKKTGLITKIRGRYTHREIHYLAEFNYICEKQKINGELKAKLHNAIFYQRPLKSQKGSVASCPLEPKRKRIAVSHPLYEEFRMWESINRIKSKKEGQTHFTFLTPEEKKLIKPLFMQKTDFEFNKIAAKLSGDMTYSYIKTPEKVFFKGSLEAIEGGVAEVYFNFPLDKKFSACPTISSITKLLGKNKYNELPLLNTGYINEKGKMQISIEDIWHCLFLDSFGKIDKKQGRKEFAIKHLYLDDKGVENFQKIKLAKGYGSLSKAALKKIVPFLKKGEIYTNAVFLANISEVLKRKITDDEQRIITKKINEALEIHKVEKQNNGIVNNYIGKVKGNKESVGNNPFSIKEHENGLKRELIDWIGESEFNRFTSDEKDDIIKNCWNKFSRVSMDKHPNAIEYIPTVTVTEIIKAKLTEAFPKDRIDVEKLYHPSAMEAYKPAYKKLGNPEISSIKNPVFNRSMHQIKRLCNELIRKGIVTKETEVNVELAREINSASYRSALTQWQKEQEIIRDWAKHEIINSYPKDCRNDIIPTDKDILKFVLWKEQNHQCLYTGAQISICEFIGGKTTFDIEHTIPRSKFHDNSLANITLANAEFNRKVKRDILPGLLNENFKGTTINIKTIILNRNANLKSYFLKNNVPTWSVSLESLKNDYEKYKNSAKYISEPVAHSEVMTKAHYARIKLDYLSRKYKNLESEEITNQFTNANLVDTRIIAKYARAYLKSYFNKVNVVNGKITDTLRKMWGLEGEYTVKDRSNHIHHCIDATTVACVERGTANWISEAFHKYEQDYFKGNNNPKYFLKEPMINFAEKMHNLHQEVFIFHKQTDRIKPFLEAVEKKTTKKQNLRGKLNSQNPYAHIKKDDKLIFAQRKPVSKLTEKDFYNIIDEGIKTRIENLTKTSSLMEFIKEANKNGFMKLPPYYDKEKKREISGMILKRVRIDTKQDKLKDYKEIRVMDKSKYEHKRDFYFDKDSYTNYEARIFGDLTPEINGKFNNRRYKLINHYNIVKNIFEKEIEKPVLKLHQDDLFLVFDKNPNDEICWENNMDIQKRLFKVVKFDENGIIVLVRHNYALGNVDKAKGIKFENNLTDFSEVVLRRSPSTLRVIPAKLDSLGNIDIEFSKKFVELNS